jgi:hypothetical protein
MLSRQFRSRTIAITAAIALSSCASSATRPAESASAQAPAPTPVTTSRADDQSSILLARLPSAPDSTVFVTRLGADTLVVERVVHRPGRIDADVLSRVPRTMHTVYVLELSPAGELTRYYAEVHDLRDGTVARRDSVIRVGDSLRVVTTTGGDWRVTTLAAPRGTLPFIDMVHWPYEVLLQRARLGAGPMTAPLLTGNRITEFRVERISVDSATITHPLRGTMRAQVDVLGRLVGLDAGATTRKLVLERRGWMSFDDLTSRWLALDKAGRGVTALSGRAQTSAKLGAVNVSVDYGTPAARGRAIWGALVPYGKVWRTGANEATHLTVDGGTLVIGSGADTLAIPAGRYTLYSIPEPAGGTLIVNRQTGQGGTTYEVTRDLGRVRLASRPLSSPVEQFTIAITGAGTSGELRLQWSGTELFVPARAH